MKMLRWMHDHGLETIAVVLFAVLILLTLSQVAGALFPPFLHLL